MKKTPRLTERDRTLTPEGVRKGHSSWIPWYILPKPLPLILCPNVGVPVVLGDKYFEDFGDIFVTLGDQDTTEICTEIL